MICEKNGVECQFGNIKEACCNHINACCWYCEDARSCRIIHVNKKHPIENKQKIQQIAKALSSMTRLKILELLRNNNKQWHVTGIAEKFKMTEANISAQAKILKNAWMINVNYSEGKHGIRTYLELSELGHFVVTMFENGVHDEYLKNEKQLEKTPHKKKYN